MVFKRTMIRVVSLLLALAVVFSASASTFATAGKYSESAIEETRRRFSEKIVEIARAEIGFYEDDINKYTTWYYGHETASDWCAIFVSWCAGQAGCLDSAIPQRNACSSMRNFFKFKDQYYPVDSGYVPQKGDIVFWNTATDGTDDIHHVEIITEDGFITEGSTVYVKSIGGNTSNLYYHGWEYVAEKQRPVKGPRAEIVGYAHPSYEKAERLAGLIKTGIQDTRNDDLRYMHSKYLVLLYHIEKYFVEIYDYFDKVKTDTENWFKDLFNIKDDEPVTEPESVVTEPSTENIESTTAVEFTEPVSETTTEVTTTLPAETETLTTTQETVNGRPVEKLFPVTTVPETEITEAA